MMPPEISQIGDVRDAPKPLMGPTRPKALEIEVGTVANPSQMVLTLTQDAALELAAKLTQFLKVRGCL